MTNEEKELLLKDLCARVPYEVKCKTIDKENIEINHSLTGIIIEAFKEDIITDIKPYLRPMSSMTAEEWIEYCDASLEDEKSWVWAGKEYRFTPVTHREEFLNSHHFDYRGLIPIGLALEASEDMYKFD